MTDQCQSYQCVNVFQSALTGDNLSRHEMLNWVNESLEADYRKVEELCSGKLIDLCNLALTNLFLFHDRFGLL